MRALLACRFLKKEFFCAEESSSFQMNLENVFNKDFILKPKQMTPIGKNVLQPWNEKNKNFLENVNPFRLN